MTNILLLLVVTLPASITSFSISVYDNVIGPSTCRTLHTLTQQHTRRSHDGSSLFHRGPKQKLTPIENVLDSILRQLNDTSPMVEYWSRSQYMNLDAHADIDEDTLKEEGVLRCPRHGHVLYLQIAASSDNMNGNENSGYEAATVAATTISDEEKQSRMGPTVVFNRKVAWGSVTPRTVHSGDLNSNFGAASHNSPENRKERVQEYIVDVENYWDEETKRQYGLLDNDKDAQDTDGDKMAIVPAVNGRLLRFDGEAFHCVPKPPDRFLFSGDELTAFLEKDCEEDCEDDDYWDDEDDDDLEREDLSQQRSVILFNTWPAGSSGPRGVLPDCVVEAVPDGIVLDEDDSASVEDERLAEQWKNWQDEYGPDAEKLYCNPADDWKLCIVDSLDGGDETCEITVPLMGNPTRRGCIQSKATMQCQGLKKRVENAFYDGRQVSMTTLNELP
jgi:hypothetical protein